MPGWDETEHEIRYRIEAPDHFYPDSFRRKEIDDGVAVVLGKHKPEYRKEGEAVGSMHVQAYRFDREKFTVEEAKRWIEKHGKRSWTAPRVLRTADDGSFEFTAYDPPFGSVGLDGAMITHETDLGMDVIPRPLPLLFHHVQPVEDERGPIDLPRRIGTIIEEKVDDFGRWIKAEVRMVEQYRRLIEHIRQKIDAGEMGLSTQALASSAAGVLRPDGTWVWRTYHIVEDSLTPVPAEPRTMDHMRLLRQVMTSQEWRSFSEAHGLREGPADSDTSHEEEKMEEKQVAPDTGAEKLTELVERAVSVAFAKLVKTEPTDKAPVSATVGADRAAQRPFRHVGERIKAVIDWRKNGQWDPRIEQLLPRGASGPTGMNEAVASEGGYWVGEDQKGFIAKTYEQSRLLPLVTQHTCSANSNRMTWLLSAEESRVKGTSSTSRYGGFRWYNVPEGATGTYTFPATREFELRLKKKMALIALTHELEQDAEALRSYIMTVASAALAAELDDDMINGVGGNGGVGFLASPALKTIAKESGQAADTVVVKNLLKMYAGSSNPTGSVWLCHQRLIEQFPYLSIDVGTGGMPVYVGPGGIKEAPQGTILGRPVYFHESMAAPGDVGDIAFVDPKEIWTLSKGGVEEAESQHVLFAYAENVIRLLYRFSCGSPWTAALTLADGTNTVSPFVVLAAR